MVFSRHLKSRTRPLTRLSKAFQRPLQGLSKAFLKAFKRSWLGPWLLRKGFSRQPDQNSRDTKALWYRGSRGSQGLPRAARGSFKKHLTCFQKTLKSPVKILLKAGGSQQRKDWREILAILAALALRVL